MAFINTPSSFQSYLQNPSAGTALSLAGNVTGAFSPFVNRQQPSQTSSTSIGDIRLGSPVNLGIENYANIEELVNARTPEATRLIGESTREALRLSDLASEQVDPLRRFGDLAAFEEQQALLGIKGPQAQAEALQSVSQSPAEREANRRQRETMLRQAAATGDVSGAAMLEAGQLGAAQRLAMVKNRLAELEPLAAIARSTRAGLSQQAELARARRAQILSGRGTKLADIRLGAAAPMASSIQERAELSGLRGISDVQQQNQMLSQIAGLAGQYAPGIASYYGYGSPSGTEASGSATRF